MRSDVYQIEHGLLNRVLHGFLVSKMESSRDGGEFDRVACGAGAALESLLAAHPLDRRGRCRWCRGPGWMWRRRRVCMVFEKAHYWLRQSTHRVQTHLAAELGLDPPPPPGTADPDATEVQPQATDDPATDPLQTPAASPTPTTEAEQPDRDRGEAGRHQRSQSHRGPSEDLPPGPRPSRKA